MAHNLERRRLAIAEALRAVMAEARHDGASWPQSAVPTQATHAHTADLRPADAAFPLPATDTDADTGAVVTMLRPRPSAVEAAAEPASELPSIRAALAAAIDWEDNDAIEPAVKDVSPAADAGPAEVDPTSVQAEAQVEAQVEAPVELDPTPVQTEVAPVEVMAPAEADGQTEAEAEVEVEVEVEDTPSDPTVEDVKMDGSAGSIPPIDTVGSMSSVASLALFGHA